MYLLKSCALALALVLLSGCATPAPKLQTGDYMLYSLNEDAAPMNVVISMSLSETELYLAGPNNIWKAPVSKNTIGQFIPVKRSKSSQIGGIEGMFLQTLDGATIENAPNGYLRMRRNTQTVAIFKPIPDEVETTPTGK